MRASSPALSARLPRWLLPWSWAALMGLLGAATLKANLHAHWLDLVWPLRDLSDAQWPATFTRLRLWLNAGQLVLGLIASALVLHLGRRGRGLAAAGLLAAALLDSGLWVIGPAAGGLAGGVLRGLAPLLLGAALLRWAWVRPRPGVTLLVWGLGAALTGALLWTLAAVPLDLSAALPGQVPPALLWNELIRPALRDLGLAALVLCALLTWAQRSPGALRGGLMRGLVFTGLSLGTALTFTLVVGGASLLLRTGTQFWPSVAAAALVAATIEPARTALTRSLRRMLYGERDDPFAVMQGLARHLGGLPLQAGLSSALTEVARALRLPYLALRFASGEVLASGPLPAQAQPTPPQPQQAQARFQPPPEHEHLPLIAQGERLGTLEVARRSPRETFSRAEWALLEALARQLAGAAWAWQLAAQLQASQADLIRAGEEERRRLRRDLHDGLGPSLAGLGLKLEAARLLLGRSPERAAEHLAVLKQEVQESVSEVRRLVHDLRPPKLDDLGLAGALEELLVGVRQAGLDAALELPPMLPPLGAALEVAVYRIAQEALTNVMKHARASRVELRLGLTAQHLTLECRDDGVGLPGVREPGVGSRSMRERAGALSGTLDLLRAEPGGTLVRARLPLKPETASFLTPDR